MPDDDYWINVQNAMNIILVLDDVRWVGGLMAMYFAFWV